jgi:hypothetical protein
MESNQTRYCNLRLDNDWMWFPYRTSVTWVSYSNLKQTKFGENTYDWLTVFLVDFNNLLQICIRKRKFLVVSIFFFSRFFLFKLRKFEKSYSEKKRKRFFHRSSALRYRWITIREARFPQICVVESSILNKSMQTVARNLAIWYRLDRVKLLHSTTANSWSMFKCSLFLYLSIIVVLSSINADKKNLGHSSTNIRPSIMPSMDFGSALNVFISERIFVFYRCKSM